MIAFFFQDKPPQKHITSREKLQSLDLIGTAIFLPTVVCLLLALQWGGQKYPWSNARIIVLFVLFGVGLCIWLYVQHARQELATVPPRIIKNRNVWGALAYNTCLGGAFFVSVYYVCFSSASHRQLLTRFCTSFPSGFRQSKAPMLPGLAL